MRLVPIPDASGTPTQWVNPEHVVSVQAIFRTGERDIQLERSSK